jgi:hypothetical protein
MDIHTCEGTRTFTSGVRAAGTGMCDDFWRVHNALAQREICCDGGPREEKRPPAENRPPKRECEPATPWFGDAGPCKDMQSPQLVIRQGTATLSMCGYAVFSHKDASLNDKLFADAYRFAMRDQLASSSASQVCCDKFREAVRTRKPCDPRTDVDCDGTPNRTDRGEGNMPDIDGFSRAENAAIDTFPEYFNTTNPDFLPNRAARESRGVGDCPCKWELVKGELN